MSQFNNEFDWFSATLPSHITLQILILPVNFDEEALTNSYELQDLDAEWDMFLYSVIKIQDPPWVSVTETMPWYQWQENVYSIRVDIRETNILNLLSQ